MRYVVTRTFLALGFVYELYENRLALREFLTSGLKSEKTEWAMALLLYRPRDDRRIGLGRPLTVALARHAACSTIRPCQADACVAATLPF